MEEINEQKERIENNNSKIWIIKQNKKREL